MKDNITLVNMIIGRKPNRGKLELLCEDSHGVIMFSVSWDST